MRVERFTDLSDALDTATERDAPINGIIAEDEAPPMIYAFFPSRDYREQRRFDAARDTISKDWPEIDQRRRRIRCADGMSDRDILNHITGDGA